MKKFSKLVSMLSSYMSIVAGITLILVMLLTVVDVILRYFDYPITGVYDLVAIGGSIIVGFSIPYAADKKVHVYMEMVQQFNSKILKNILYAVTRLIAFGISLMIAWNLLKLGFAYKTTGEASLTIQVAYYPIAIGLGICFFIQTLVFIEQFCSIFFGGNNGGNNE